MDIPEKETHSPIDNLTFTFDVPGKTILALYNAVGFTLAHRDLYTKEFEDCSNCFEAMRSLNSYFWNLMNSVDGPKPINNKLN